LLTACTPYLSTHFIVYYDTYCYYSFFVFYHSLFFLFFFFFFFNDPATTEIYTLPYTTLFRSHSTPANRRKPSDFLFNSRIAASRSEEHTSELQSPYDLVCRLLLEKKKKKKKKNYIKINNK